MFRSCINVVTAYEMNELYFTKKVFLFCKSSSTSAKPKRCAVDLHCRPMASPKEGCDGLGWSGVCLNLLHAWNAPAGLVRLRDPARGSGRAWLEQAGQNSHFARRRGPCILYGAPSCENLRREMRGRCCSHRVADLTKNGGGVPACTREHTSQPYRQSRFPPQPRHPRPETSCFPFITVTPRPPTPIRWRMASDRERGRPGVCARCARAKEKVTGTKRTRSVNYVCEVSFAGCQCLALFACSRAKSTQPEVDAYCFPS